MISGSVSVMPSIVIEASIVVCFMSLWLMWVNVHSGCALNTRYSTWHHDALCGSCEQEEQTKLAGKVERAQADSSSLKNLLETCLDVVLTVSQEVEETKMRWGESECLLSLSKRYRFLLAIINALHLHWCITSYDGCHLVFTIR
jgi:hypothetical protein